MRLYADKTSGWGKDSFDVSAATKDEMDNRDRKSDFNFSHKKGDYNVVGLNVTKVSSEMIPAIENWVKSMENKLNQIDETREKQNIAFKDENVQRAVFDFVVNVKEYCINLTSDLLAFADKLKSVEKTYKTNLSKLSQGIDELAKKNSVGDRYTQKM